MILVTRTLAPGPTNETFHFKPLSVRQQHDVAGFIFVLIQKGINGFTPCLWADPAVLSLFTQPPHEGPPYIA